jgi:lysophospholipase L1-like esterase
MSQIPSEQKSDDGVRKPQSIAVNMGLLALALLVILLLAEAGLRWLYPHSDQYFVLAPGQELVQRPSKRYVSGVEGTSVYRTSSWGIRGEEFGADGSEYRILAVGGSTTQNLYLDQTETWTLLFGDLLGPTRGGLHTWTGDVGTSGRTARSHVLQMRYLLPELPRMDAVVSLVGVNDLTTALRQGFDYEPPPSLDNAAAERKQLAQAFVRVPGRIHNRVPQYWEENVPWFKRLAVYQLARVVKISIEQAHSNLNQDPFGEIYVTWRKHRAEASEVIDSLPDLRGPLDEYRGYLEEMAVIAKEQGVRLVLLTQPTLWRADLTAAEGAALWLGGTGEFQEEPGHAYFSARVLQAAMDAYNQTLLDVCATGQVECYDLAARIPKNLDNFYDDVHFTERGSRLVAESLAGYFASLPPYEPEN